MTCIDSTPFPPFAANTTLNHVPLQSIMTNGLPAPVASKPVSSITTTTTTHAAPAAAAAAPQLVIHQKDYVNQLVDIVALTLEKLWPSPLKASSDPTTTTTTGTTAPLKTFLQHLLKHSRTTHSTLQLALYYLFRCKSRLPLAMQELDVHDRAYVVCGRRMFLASLICAQKFLQDKTYKNKAWTQISGLPVQQITQSERVFLWLLDYRLYVSKEAYDHWLVAVQHQLGMAGVLVRNDPPHFEQPIATQQPVPNKPTKHALLPTPPNEPLDDHHHLPPKKRRIMP
ncbi:hypothetical protein BC940DRAFT_290045 [Gongronella butleri]|nr:hypothetical protein BC940DRAFT_290045 [Gongronella butleri]